MSKIIASILLGVLIGVALHRFVLDKTRYDEDDLMIAKIEGKIEMLDQLMKRRQQ